MSALTTSRSDQTITFIKSISQHFFWKTIKTFLKSLQDPSQVTSVRTPTVALPCVLWQLSEAVYGRVARRYRRRVPSTRCFEYLLRRPYHQPHSCADGRRNHRTHVLHPPTDLHLRHKQTNMCLWLYVTKYKKIYTKVKWLSTCDVQLILQLCSSKSQPQPLSVNVSCVFNIDT